MALSISTLTSGNYYAGGANTNSQNTASVTLTTGRKYYLCLVYTGGGAGMGISGGTTSWSLIHSYEPNHKLRIYEESSGNAYTGALTIADATAFSQPFWCLLEVIDGQYSTVDWTSGYEISGSGTPPTYALALTGITAGRGVISWFGSRYGSNAASSTPRSGWTEACDIWNSDIRAGVCHYRVDNDSATDLTVNTGTAGLAAIAIEIEETGGDTTEPTLSSPSGSATGSTTADGSVDTDEDNGTLYWVVTESGTAPSVAQIQAGQDNSGSAAADDGSQAVSGTGTQNVSASGLTASTTYYFHFQHQDTATNDSTVATSSSFNTEAPGTDPEGNLVGGKLLGGGLLLRGVLR